ncbi:MAG TPA: hypothetical protein ENK23_08020 [Sorangium sp.]|nr:hypothetical protein [Sorangium sp.]
MAHDRSLSSVMAEVAIDAIVQREHALLSGAQSAAIQLELEAAIRSASAGLMLIASARQHHRNHDHRRDRHHPPHNPSPAAATADTDGTDLTHKAVTASCERIAVTIVRLLHHSDHVEDIYASDVDIRRDVAAALARCFDDHVGQPQRGTSLRGREVRVQLHEVGTTGAYLARALHASACRQLLSEAAARAGATLVRFQPQMQSAVFLFSDPTRGNAIAIEDAIVATLLCWVQADKIKLPHVEQLLHWPHGQLRAPAMAAALSRARDRVRQHHGCLAHTTILNQHTLRVRLVPLSQAAADNLDSHYDMLLESIQAGLAAVFPASSKKAPPVGAAASPRRRPPSSANYRTASTTPLTPPASGVTVPAVSASSPPASNSAPTQSSPKPLAAPERTTRAGPPPVRRRNKTGG